MAKTTIKIDKFDGGMVNDPREKWRGQCRVSKNFDVLTDSHRMVPYLSMVTEGTGDTEKLVQILSSGNAVPIKHYALGVDAGTTKPQIFERTSPSGAWAASTTAIGGNTGRNEDFFIEYKDVIYFLAGTKISAWTIGGTVTNDVATLSSSTSVTCPPIVDTMTDILYGANDNVLFSKDGGAVGDNWNMAALTLPTNLVITSITQFGIYLAIACRSKYSNGNSVVYLWDKDSSVDDLTKRIDWGSGDVAWIQELNGILIGASRIASQGVVSSRIVFKFYNGTGAQVFHELLASSTNVLLDQHTIRTIKRVYFMMAAGLSDKAYTGAAAVPKTVLEGVFSIGINKDGKFVLNHERLLNNDTDTALTTGSDVLHGLFLQGDTMTVMYTDAGSYVAKRSDIVSSGMSASSIYESVIFSGEDVNRKKKLLGVSISHESLVGSGSVTVSYKKEAETSWTAIMTSNTVGTVQKSAVTDASGISLPEFKEIQFKIASTNGAVITGLKFSYSEDEEIY